MGSSTNWPSASEEEEGSRPLGISHKTEKMGWEEDWNHTFFTFSEAG